MADDLDSLVRRVDEDRWLASRFAPADVRTRLVALYAVNYEIARTGEVVREAGLGAVRLAWWREALGEIAAGAPAREHPALAALTAAGVGPAAIEALQPIAEAHAADFEAAPFADWRELDLYVDATAAQLMRAAAHACGWADAEAVAAVAGRAWGYAGLMRAAEHWRARGRSVLPRSEADAHAMLARARAAYAEARALPAPPSLAFPAYGYAALLPGYFRALERGRMETSPLARRLRLIGTAATGRI